MTTFSDIAGRMPNSDRFGSHVVPARKPTPYTASRARRSLLSSPYGKVSGVTPTSTVTHPALPEGPLAEIR